MEGSEYLEGISGNQDRRNNVFGIGGSTPCMSNRMNNMVCM